MSSWQQAGRQKGAGMVHGSNAACEACLAKKSLAKYYKQEDIMACLHCE